MNPADPADLLTTIAAENVFDAVPELPHLSVSTLIIGGARDRFCSPRLVIETANRIPAARLILHRRKGHLGAIAFRSAIAHIDRFLTGQAAPA